MVKIIDEVKAKTVSNCNRKCKDCEDMVEGFCSIIFEVIE